MAIEWDCSTNQQVERETQTGSLFVRLTDEVVAEIYPMHTPPSTWTE